MATPTDKEDFISYHSFKVLALGRLLFAISYCARKYGITATVDMARRSIFRTSMGNYRITDKVIFFIINVIIN